MNKKSKVLKKEDMDPQKIPLVFLLLLAFTTYVKYGHLNIYSFDHLLIFLPTDTVENILKLVLKRRKKTLFMS